MVSLQALCADPLAVHKHNYIFRSRRRTGRM